jgi:hypothetical protein
VKCGRIQVDGEMVPVSYVVKSSQKISHFLHRFGKTLDDLLLRLLVVIEFVTDVVMVLGMNHL